MLVAVSRPEKTVLGPAAGVGFPCVLAGFICSFLSQAGSDWQRAPDDELRNYAD